MTGWAGVAGRPDSDYDSEMELDSDPEAYETFPTRRLSQSKLLAKDELPRN